MVRELHPEKLGGYVWPKTVTLFKIKISNLIYPTYTLTKKLDLNAKTMSVFETKMAKIDTIFVTKTAKQVTIPWG